MTKEYKGEEFREPFCEALAKPGAVVKWERLEEMWVRGFDLPKFDADTTYRFQPIQKRMITMYDKHGKPHLLVAPEREKPQLGQLIYIHGDKAATTWLASGWQEYLLYQRLIFLTAEDSQAMADFQREQREGMK